MSDGANSPTITIGRLLQEARSAKGLTIEAAAAASKVSITFVRLMEQEQFHLLPDPLYIVRFLMEYSASLGLDPKQVEAQFRRQVKSVWARVPPQAEASMGLGSKIHLRSLLPYVLPAVVVIPLIFVVLSLFSGRPPELPSGRQPQSSLPQEAASPPSQGGEIAPPSLPSRYTLKAEAKETTWLAVSVDGSARRETLLRRGEAEQWSANKGFVVTIGNSEGILLSLNGKLVPLKRGRSQVIRDLTLPGDGEPVTTQ